MPKTHSYKGNYLIVYFDNSGNPSRAVYVGSCSSTEYPNDSISCSQAEVALPTVPALTDTLTTMRNNGVTEYKSKNSIT